jgi:hypothetical protein
MFQIRKEPSVAFEFVRSILGIFRKRVHDTVMGLNYPIVLMSAIFVFIEFFVTYSKSVFQYFGSCIGDSSGG